MSTPADGGPAFPREGNTPAHTKHVCSQSGMSLRDYFAGQWLAGLGAFDGVDMSTKEIAKACYLVADEMLAARATGKGKP